MPVDPINDTQWRLLPAHAAACKIVWVDGGCVESNPSTIGGTWAFLCASSISSTDMPASRIIERSGYVSPVQIGLTTVSNNVTELLAITLALEALPDKWSGACHSDSLVSIRRARDPQTASMAGVPAWLQARLCDARVRLGEVSFVLYGGHPTKAELKEGKRKDGKPCHWHNVRCDNLCRERALDRRPLHAD